VDGPGIEFRWGHDIFRTRPDRPWGLPSVLYNVYWVFPWSKSGQGVTLNTQPRLAQKVELNLCAPSGTSWPVLRRILGTSDKNHSTIFILLTHFIAKTTLGLDGAMFLTSRRNFPDFFSLCCNLETLLILAIKTIFFFLLIAT
jgi:hypothetical protein